MTIEQAYHGHKKMIKKSAWMFSKKYSVEMDELEAEGNLIFCKAFQDYKPSFNASFPTFLWMNLQHKLKYFCKKQMSINIEFLEEETPQQDNAYEKIEFDFDRKKFLSEKENEIVDRIIAEKKYRKKSFQRHFTKEKNWKQKDYLYAISNIKKYVRSEQYA